MYDKEKIYHIASFLTKCDLFRSLAKKSLFKLAVEFDEVKLNRGKFVYEEGDAVDGFYLIVEGDFQVSKIVGTKPSFH